MSNVIVNIFVQFGFVLLVSFSILGVVALLLCIFARKAKQAPKTICLNTVCDELDAMCGAPRNRTVLSTKITIDTK